MGRGYTLSCLEVYKSCLGVIYGPVKSIDLFRPFWDMLKLEWDKYLFSMVQILKIVCFQF